MYYSINEVEKIGWCVTVHDVEMMVKKTQDPEVDWDKLITKYKYPKYNLPISNENAAVEIKRWLDLYQVNPANKIKPVAIAA
jgi:hypothetical protein